MDARDAITPAALHLLPAGTPVTLIGNRQGYAVAVGPADRPRWLHSTSGQIRTFCSTDRAAAVLRECGIYRFSVDITGGTPK